MKKVLSIFVALILMIGMCNGVNAYSTNEYSIDVPSTYTMVAQNNFAKADGDSFNIQETQYTGLNSDPYTQEMLDELVNEIYNNTEQYKESIRQELKQTYGAYVTDSQIEEVVSTFKCDSVDQKEITTCTKNNYKCFHIVSSYSLEDEGFYCNQYAILSGKTIYTLTFSSYTKSNIDSDEVQGIIDSFTINNYQAPADSSGLFGFLGDGIFKWIIIGVAVCAVLGVVIYFSNKKQNKETL